MSAYHQNSVGQSGPPGQTPRRDSAVGGKSVNKEHVVWTADRESVGYCIEDHCGQVMKTLNSQREAGVMCDVVVLVNNSVHMKAHRCVLAANSPYFGAQLSSAKGSGLSSTLSVEAKDPKVIESILDFMYSGQLSVSMATVEEVLLFCDHLEMNSNVKICCAQHLEKNLDISNWSQTLQLADRHDLEFLQKSIQKFVIDNFSLIYQEREICNLPVLEFVNILSHCNEELDCDIESYAAEAILRWTTHNFEERKDNFPQLLSMLRTEIISKDSLDQILEIPSIRDSAVFEEVSLGDFVNKVYTIQEEKLRRLEEEEAKMRAAKHVPSDKEQLKSVETVDCSNGLIKKEVSEADGPLRIEIGASSEQTEVKMEHRSPVPEYVKYEEDTGDHDEVSDADTDVYVPTDEVTHNMQQTTDVKDAGKKVDTGTSPDTFDLLRSTKPVVILEPLDPAFSQRSKRKASRPVKIESKFVEEFDSVPVKRGRGRPPKNKANIKYIPKRKPSVKKSTKKKKTKSFGTQTLEDTIDNLLREEEEKDNLNDGAVEEEGVKSDTKLKTKVKIKKRGRPKNTEDGNIKCPKCPRVFPTTQALQRHILGHGRDVPYLCDICGFTTRHVNSIRLHKNRHNELRIYKCTKCPKLFKTPGALKHHLKGHGVETPFLCEMCGFSTRHLGSMNVHKRQHDGNKFKCTYPGCTYENIRKSRLDDHMSAHQGIKNHVCSVCGKAFAGRKHMQRHEKIHQEVKPIQCERCDWRSTRRDKLRDHIRKHHSEWALLSGYATSAEIEKAKQPEPPRPKRIRTNKKRRKLPLEEGDTAAAALEGMGARQEVLGTKVVPVSQNSSTINEDMLSYLTNMEASDSSSRALAEAAQSATEPGSSGAPSLVVAPNPAQSHTQPAMGVDHYWLYVHSNAQQYQQ